jgi:hypothetical protein
MFLCIHKLKMVLGQASEEMMQNLFLAATETTSLKLLTLGYFHVTKNHVVYQD